MPAHHRAPLLFALVLALVLPLLLAASASAVLLKSPAWAATYSKSPAADIYYDVARGPGDVFYAVGVTKATEEVSTLLLGKYKADGTSLWQKAYTMSGVTGSAGAAVRVNKWGGVLIAGSVGRPPSSSAKGRDIVVLKYSPAGKLLWATKYGGPAGKDDYPTDMAIDAEGTAYVVGASTGTGTGLDYALLRVRGDGKLQWAFRYAGPAKYDYPRGIALDGDSNSYVTGESRRTGGGMAAATLKVSRSGKLIWQKRYRYGTGGDTRGADIVVKGSGGVAGVYIGGTAEFGMSARDDMIVARVSTVSGAKKSIGQADVSGGNETGSKLAVDATGNAYVVGDTVDPAPPYVRHAVVAKVPYGGGLDWVGVFWLDAVGNESSLQAVGLDAVGNVYFGGYADRTVGSSDFYVGSVEPDRTYRWQSAQGGTAGNDDFCRALVVRTNGVFAVGQLEYVGSGIDALIEKIDR